VTLIYGRCSTRGGPGAPHSQIQKPDEHVGASAAAESHPEGLNLLAQSDKKAQGRSRGDHPTADGSGHAPRPVRGPLSMSDRVLQKVSLALRVVLGLIAPNYSGKTPVGDPPQ